MTTDPSSEPAPEMVERVAKAIYMSAVESARGIVAGKTLPVEKIKAVFDDAISASDREAAIIVFALIDDIATDFFRDRLTGNVPDGIDQSFFSASGMLGSAHNKILLMAGLQWIRIDTYKELRLIRRIRNEFAHHVEHKSFTESPIRDFIGSMAEAEAPVWEIFQTHTVPDQLKSHPELAKIANDLLHEGPPVRVKFMIRSCLATAGMIQDIAFIQAALSHRVHPGSLAGDFDSQPENIKELMRTVSRLSFQAIQNDLAPRILQRAGPGTELPPLVPGG
jgi:hypothetical protein